MSTKISQGTTENENFKVIGKNPVRHDGVDKVTGRAKYGADINMAGLLHGKILITYVIQIVISGQETVSLLGMVLVLN